MGLKDPTSDRESRMDLFVPLVFWRVRGTNKQTKNPSSLSRSSVSRIKSKMVSFSIVIWFGAGRFEGREGNGVATSGPTLSSVYLPPLLLLI